MSAFRALMLTCMSAFMLSCQCSSAFMCSCQCSSECLHVFMPLNMYECLHAIHVFVPMYECITFIMTCTSDFMPIYLSIYMSVVMPTCMNALGSCQLVDE